ncbi:hypothetical protein SLS64_010791 [Diaporthe eres]|uniref:Protein kinase domain-containing protein n=1 Tax=Diaporthe eres TaxID=83184 RepID=A0ABR1NN09_DIAER
MDATTPSSIELQEAEDFLRRLTAPPPIFKFWSPPEDPDKPRLPYIPGFTVQIRRHVPPPPFGGPDYGMGTREVLSESYLREITQSELVIDHPGLDTPLPALSETAQLTVMTPITIGEVRGAQVVACEISPQNEGDQPFQAVAKIYDPMYYSFEWNFSHQTRDTVWQADSDYSREAAAYEHLQKNVTPFAPQYFGSWTFDLPFRNRGVPKTRHVRMILIERLDGMSMRTMRVRNNPDPEEADDAFHYPEDFRLEVLAVAMDGYVRMLRSGLDQRDFASRNVMLDISAKPSAEVPVISGLPLPRIVLVDYNTSVVYGLTAQGDNPQHRTPLPINPMQLWWGMPMNEFVGWVPHEWHSTPRLKREWLEKRFGGTEQRKLYTMDKEPQFEIDD